MASGKGGLSGATDWVVDKENKTIYFRRPGPSLADIKASAGGGGGSLRALGVGRVADNPRALLVALSDEPSDDDIRRIYERLRR